jgi:DNA-directed RNA polymerase subunit RPC12/RpoP
VKSEFNEFFIDCNPASQNDDHLHPQVVIKSEAEDIVIEALEEIEDAIGFSKDLVEKFGSKQFKKSKENEENLKDNIEIVCDECGHKCSFKIEMETHMHRFHASKEPQTFYCEFCSREFDKVIFS